MQAADEFQFATSQNESNAVFPDPNTAIICLFPAQLHEWVKFSLLRPDHVLSVRDEASPSESLGFLYPMDRILQINRNIPAFCKSNQWQHTSIPLVWRTSCFARTDILFISRSVSRMRKVL
uniref:Uncharacterized protein n=1 Tax=Candidatus Kentrum sp. LFY TaxID=2126342 RepID=A0A450WVP3_9GAMM|nr:MAG: hypothetical protein BECKLFY1418C_GA0070996_108613 [Candidatus Kentron sp. LFY]